MTLVVKLANVVEVVPVPPLAIGRVPVTSVAKLTAAIVGFALNTAAPEPAPSVTTINLEPLGTLTVAPEPCLIVMICEPVVAFSMIQTLLTVLGARVTVRVADRETAEVSFKYSERVPSAVASGMVKVSSASAASCLVPRLNASAIRERLVLVLVPQVPD